MRRLDLCVYGRQKYKRWHCGVRGWIKTPINAVRNWRSSVFNVAFCSLKPRYSIFHQFYAEKIVNTGNLCTNREKVSLVNANTFSVE